jgi:predicted outer membrane repeat protein
MSMSFRGNRSGVSGGGILAGLLALAVAAVVVANVIGLAGSGGSSDGGHVTVVRNGGLFDDTSIYKILQPNSGLQYEGQWSTEHPYPVGQRNFVVSGAPGADSNEVINVQTKDGVLIGIEGTFFFQLNTDEAVLREFDDKFGTRTYDIGNNQRDYAWNSDEGWKAFLNFTIGNFVQNSLREAVGNVSCPDLVPSCVLAQARSTANGQPPVINDGNGNQTISNVQDAVTKALQNDIKSHLGNDYFTNINFVMSKPTLPPNIQDAINTAQAAFTASAAATAKQQADNIEAQTRKQVAQTNAEANAITQQGYANCPVCAQIDLTKALPQSITVYAPGNGSSIAIPAK